MGKTKRLSKEETRALIRKSQEGDEDAREELVKKNTNLVWDTVQKFRGRGHDLEDLFQVGCMGMVYCIDHFDLTQDVEFASYVVRSIKGRIQTHLRTNRPVSIPRSLIDVVTWIRQKDLADETEETIVKELKLEGYLVPVVKEALQFIHTDKGVPASLDFTTKMDKDGREVTLGSFIEGDINGSDWVEQLEVSEELRKVIDRLGDREKYIINNRFFENKTQQQVADELGIGRSYVSRLEASALEKLKQLLTAKTKLSPKPFVKETMRSKKERITVGNSKVTKGNREEAIRLLESTELTYKEIAARTEVPLSTVGGLAGTYRTKAVKNKNRAKNAPRKGGKKSKNKQAATKKTVPTQAPPVQTTPPVQFHYAPPIEKVELQPITALRSIEGVYELGGEPSLYMQQIEKQGKELAKEMEKVTNKANVEYNFNFNVKGEMVSVDEVITKLEELKTMLSHIPVDVVNFRINVGS